MFALVLVWAPAPARAQALLKLDGGNASITADEMSGTRLRPQFDGNVVVHHGAQSLFADRITLEFHDDNGQNKLTKASADGDVLLIDGTTVAACQHMELQSDLVRGMLETAEIHVKRPGSVIPENFSALTAGRDSVYMSGDIERLGPKKFRIRNVYFTPCDCGKGKRPTFSVRAKSGVIEIGGDAFFYLPVLQPLDIALPVPFALPFMVFPVSKRKSGFTMPTPGARPYSPLLNPKDPNNNQGGSAFDIEESYFWAISNSTDATITGGYDVARGPRYQLEFRDALATDTTGVIDLIHGYDPRFLADHPDRANDLLQGQRLTLQGTQRVNTNGRWSLKAIGGFVSDGFYLLDNTFTLQSQAIPYLASRGVAEARGDEVRLQLGAAMYQDFSQSRHLFSVEQHRVAQRLPNADVALIALDLGDGFWLGADGRATVQQRFMRSDSVLEGKAPGGLGAVRGRTESRFELLPRLSRPTQLEGLTILPEVFGMVDAHDSSLSGASLPRGFVAGQVEASMPFARFFHVDDFTFRHRFRPLVRYLLLPTVWGDNAAATFDERDQIHAVHQGQIGGETDLFVKHGKGPSRRLVSLSVLQNFNLGGIPDARAAGAGELWTTLTVQPSLPIVLSGSGSYSYQEKRFKALSAEASFTDARLDKFHLLYQRLVGGGSARSNTGLFELAPGGAVDTALAGELHTLSVDAQIAPYTGIFLGYGIDLTLSLPDSTAPANRITFAAQHRVTTGYTSPCQCFGVQVNATILRNPAYLPNGKAAMFNDPQVVLVFTVGDYRFSSL